MSEQHSGFTMLANIDGNSATYKCVSMVDPTDEQDYATKSYVDNVATKSTVDLFLTENASDIGTYFDMEIGVVTDAKEDITQSIGASSTALIAAFASILDEAEIDNIELLESGVYDIHIHAKGENANNLYVYAEFYKRTALGAETLLGTTHDSGELTTSEVGYALHAIITSDTAWVSGDRFVTKIYGRNISAPARDVTIYMEGDTAVRVVFPAIIALGNFLLKDGSNADGTVDIGTQEFKSAKHVITQTGADNVLLDLSTTAGAGALFLMRTSDGAGGAFIMQALAGVTRIYWETGTNYEFRTADLNHIEGGVPGTSDVLRARLMSDGDLEIEKDISAVGIIDAGGGFADNGTPGIDITQQIVVTPKGATKDMTISGGIITNFV